MATTWETETVELLRVLIDDLADTPTYSDEKLQRLLLVAAFQVVREVTFDKTFTVNLTEQTLEPDPTAAATLNKDLVNLMCLKAACIMDRGAAAKAAGKAVAGKDMNAVQFDLRGVAESTIRLLKEGWCAVYKEVVFDYISGTGNLGQAVLGPFRTLMRY